MFGHPGDGYGWAVIINPFTVFASIFIPDIPDYLYFGRDIIKLFRDFLADTGFKAPALTLFFLFGKVMLNINSWKIGR
jgi:hypothetical protein